MATAQGVRTAFHVIIAGEALALASFLFAGWRADEAMDKAGLGEYSKFAYWSDWGGAAFWLVVGLWFAGTAVGWRLDRVRAQRRRRVPLALLFGLGVPAVFVLSYLAALAFA